MVFKREIQPGYCKECERNIEKVKAGWEGLGKRDDKNGTLCIICARNVEET